MGIERDIREFNDILISRIIDALDAQKKQYSGHTPTPGNPKEPEESVNQMTDLLHGKSIQQRTYKDLQSGNDVKKTQSSNFFNIFLNMESESDIYTAWESDIYETINNFEHTPG